MNKKQIKIYYIYIIFCLIFISFTTEYLNLEDIIYFANQTDAISYFEIAKLSPSIPVDSEIIIKHVAQRFLIPYLIGWTSKILQIDLFVTFKIFTFIFIFLYILIIDLIRVKLSLNFVNSILFYSLLFLNPYITRNHLFNPVQAHDMLFFCLGLVFAYSIIKNKYILNIIIVFFSIFLRQTSIAMFLASSVYLILNKKIKIFIYFIIIFLLLFIFIISLGNRISNDIFPIHLTYGILFYDFTNFEKLIKFFLLPLVAFFPLSFVIVGKKINNIKEKYVYILIFCCALMIGQPLAAGPDGSLGNVVRIANLCFPILTLLIFYFYDFSIFFRKKLLFGMFIVGLFFWSLHPTFSTIKIFSFLRFYPH